MDIPHPSFAGLKAIDWDDTASVLRGCVPVFEAFDQDPDLLQVLLDNLADDGHLKSMCERFDNLDKLVLQDLTMAGIRVRLRLHLYRAGHFDRPHNHRWSFASHIVRGRYLHRIFGHDEEFSEDTDFGSLQAIHERLEGPGATYALHHTGVHTVQGDADTISLMLRGPAAKDRMLVLDHHTGGSFWVYGVAQETPDQRASKRMTESDLAEIITRVRSLTAPHTFTGAMAAS